MTRGKQYDITTREKALALLATSNNMAEVASQMGIPETTLCTWKKQSLINTDEFEAFRIKKREEFISKAWEIIDMTVELGKNRVNRALVSEAALDLLIKEINIDEGLHPKTKEAIINKLRTLQVQGLRDISTFLGTIYDKAALAAGDPTSRVEANLSFEQMLKQIEAEN